MKNRFARISFIISLLFSTVALSNEMDGIDLKVTMKHMRFEYTQALETVSTSEFSGHINKMSELLAKAQGYQFSPERAKISLEGLDKVAVVLNTIQQTDITVGNLATVQAQLEQVDSLRKVYHKKSKPSIWQLIFG
ncbi:MAG: soluble cytochrome b562 [Moritella sp.]|jgi:soluble cytochrome b562